MQTIFWILLFWFLYTYIGYAIILFIVNLFITKKDIPGKTDFLPTVTVMICAYNEENIAEKKINNTKKLKYPQDKLKVLWVTDGSNDNTNKILEKNNINYIHQPQRKGKANAINRGMQHIDTEIVVFTDANAMLNKDAILNIVRHFATKTTGCVAGEKRIITQRSDSAAPGGESIYWKYESKLKYWDSRLNTAIGAAGEIFAIRTSLFTKIPENAIVEDFILSMNIVGKGYKIDYEPQAYAQEYASDGIAEEMKRKTRIAAGMFQAFGHLYYLLNPFFQPVTAFQFFSHKFLRYTLAPISFFLLLPVNLYLLKIDFFYTITLATQTLFYFAALMGYFFETKKIKFKILYLPYYILLMNVSVYVGFYKFALGKQKVTWTKSKRINN